MLIRNVVVKYSPKYGRYYAYTGQICFTVDFSFSSAPSDLSQPISLEGVAYPSTSDTIAFNFIVQETISD